MKRRLLLLVALRKHGVLLNCCAVGCWQSRLSLAPSDPAYKNHFNEDARQRDSAYHQGTVWPWLIGPYVDVHLRVRN
ncbi:MAG: hypothetical protein JO125_06155, partial [Chloroflexi bacterium]|nr:hypothetical protein [Chloroflexota bacterium]